MAAAMPPSTSKRAGNWFIALRGRPPSDASESVPQGIAGRATKRRLRLNPYPHATELPAMRGVLAGIAVLVLAMPAVMAHIELTANAPQAPVGMDGTATIGLTMVLDCRHVLARPGTTAFEVLLAHEDGVLNGTAPESFSIDRLSCTNPTSSVTRQDVYVIRGDRYLPGLVPINVTFTASLAPVTPSDTLDPVESVSATGTVTPAAILDYRVDALGKPLATVGGATLSTNFTNLGNIDLSLETVVAAKGVARGQLVVDAPDLVARAQSATNPSIRVVRLDYTAPNNGTGVDRYRITLQPVVVLDQAMRADPVELDVEFPYETRTDESGSTSVVVGGSGSASNPEARTETTQQYSPGIGLAQVLVLVATGAVAKRLKR